MSGEQLSYSVKEGALPGKYLVTLTPTVAAPNTLSLSIEGELVETTSVTLDVVPASIHTVQLCDSSKNILQEIPSISVDQKFEAYFIAHDVFNNQV
jgi:hypothetical protein